MVDAALFYFEVAACYWPLCLGHFFHGEQTLGADREPNLASLPDKIHSLLILTLTLSLFARLRKTTPAEHHTQAKRLPRS
jgi:hypothetical protein